MGLLAGQGEVLEIAAGRVATSPTTRTASDSTAIKSSALRCSRYRHSSGRPSWVRRADSSASATAQALKFPDESFGRRRHHPRAVHDPRTTAGRVREAHRVLRPGGRLFLLDTFAVPRLPVRAVQRPARPPGGCASPPITWHVEPLDHLDAAGSGLDGVERSKCGIRRASHRPRAEVEDRGSGRAISEGLRGSSVISRSSGPKPWRLQGI